MIKILTILFLLISVNPCLALTNQEISKLSQREKIKILAQRGTYGIFAWNKEDLNLDGKNIYVGCLEYVTTFKDKFINDKCRELSWEEDFPDCNKVKEKYKTLMRKNGEKNGQVVFIDNRNRIAPYFRALTKEEIKYLYGDRIPYCEIEDVNFKY